VLKDEPEHANFDKFFEKIPLPSFKDKYQNKREAK
jgi:hypothetical protein